MQICTYFYLKRKICEGNWIPLYHRIYNKAYEYSTVRFICCVFHLIMDSKFGVKSYSPAWFKGLEILDLLSGLVLFSMCSELWSCDDFLLWLVLANCCQTSLLVPSSLCLASNFPAADQCNVTLQNTWLFYGCILILDENHLSVLMPGVIWFKFVRPSSDKFKYVCVCIERLGSGFMSSS